MTPVNSFISISSLLRFKEAFVPRGAGAAIVEGIGGVPVSDAVWFTLMLPSAGVNSLLVAGDFTAAFFWLL